MSDFTFGCDPEVFITKNGKPASAYGLLPGDKENPHRCGSGAIQVDGMAAEFNIDPVDSNDFSSFNVAIIQQQREIKKALPKEYSVKVSPTQEFGKEFLDNQPDKAKELGCDPDYNAYTLEQNPRPDADNTTFRTGAGHLHIGWGADIPVDNPEHIEICAGIVKVLDATVGLFMSVIDQDPLRRELYGKAGAFRPKPYGVEYRTPSNAWIVNKDCRYLVHHLMNKAISYHSNNYPIHTYTPFANNNEVRQAIDNGDRIKLLIDFFDGQFYRVNYNYHWNNVKNKLNLSV